MIAVTTAHGGNTAGGRMESTSTTACTVTERDKPCLWHRHHLAECQAEDCTGCLPNMASRGHWCEKHYDRVGEALRSIADRYRDLEDWLESGSGETKGQPRVSGTVGLPSVLNDTNADHRDHIKRLMRCWIMAEFQASTDGADTTMYASAPQLRLTHLEPKALAHWLTTRLDSISRRDWAGDFADEIIAADKRAYGLTHPTGRRKVGAAACPEPACTGTVEGVVEPSELFELPAAIICTANPDHAWKPQEFVAAGQRIHKAAA